MNIIKLNSNAPIESNMYVILLHWTYIYKLSDENRNISINLEPLNNYMIEQALTDKNIPFIKLNDEAMNNYIDWSETERINGINKYLKLNSQAPAPDEISLEDAKNFRTWFATYTLNNTLKELDKDSSEYDKQVFSILDFWSKNMNSDTIKTLDLFYNSNLIINKSSNITCGCSGTTGIDISYNFNNTLKCNPLDEFKKTNINNTVFIFSNINMFWREYFSTDMINWIIKYLKSIIKCNLPLNFNSSLDISALSCSQVNSNTEIQKENQQIINNIITSLELIRDCNESTQFNFVNKSMNNFGKIYPYMQWV